MKFVYSLALALGASNGGFAFAAEIECPAVATRQIALNETGGDPLASFRVSAIVRSNGRPLLVYSGGATNAQSLYLINCLDSKCEESTRTVVDSSLNYSDGPGLALSLDGRPLLLSDQYGKLHYYECSDEACSSTRKVQVEPENPGALRALVVRSDGRPMLIYAHSQRQANDPYDVFAYVCTDTRCQSGTKTKLVDLDPEGEWYSAEASAQLDSEGRLALAYLNNNGSFTIGTTRLLRCLDADCSERSNTLTSQARNGSWPQRTSLFVLPDDRPLVLDGQSGFAGNVPWAALIECDGPTCESIKTNTLFSNANRHYAGLTVPSSSNPILGAFTGTGAGFFLCDQADCISGRLVEAPATDSHFRSSALTANAAGKPYLAYFSEQGTRLNLATCTTELWSNGFESP